MEVRERARRKAEALVEPRPAEPTSRPDQGRRQGAWKEAGTEADPPTLAWGPQGRRSGVDQEAKEEGKNRQVSQIQQGD